MSAAMTVTETNLGFLLESSKFIILFGGVKANFVNLKASYPQFQFIRVKQTHGDVVVETPDEKLDYQLEADAHFTLKTNTAVCISTADCVPAFLYDPRREVVAGIHAGWRGIENRIVPKTIEKLVNAGSRAEDLLVYVGPHIQKESFEVNEDVRVQLLNSMQLSKADLQNFPDDLFSQTLSGGKSLVDLSQILRQQLSQSHIENENLFDLHLNTVTDLRFHSHRRDKEQAGRQLSFICRY